jgi:membrane protein DedA with SNARE-associated domain
MEQALVEHGLPLAALFVFVSSFGIPTGIPIKVVLLAVGSLVVRDPSQLLVAFVLLVLAEMAGTMSLHTASGFLGSRLPDKLENTQIAARASLDRWRARLHGKDILAIFVLRLVPVVRIGLTVGAGGLGLRTRDFVLGALPAAMIWVGLPLGLGWGFRENIHQLEQYIDQTMGPVVGVVVVIVLLVALGIWKQRRTAKKTAALLAEAAELEEGSVALAGVSVQR